MSPWQLMRCTAGKSETSRESSWAQSQARGTSPVIWGIVRFEQLNIFKVSTALPLPLPLKAAEGSWEKEVPTLALSPAGDLRRGPSPSPPLLPGKQSLPAIEVGLDDVLSCSEAVLNVEVGIFLQKAIYTWRGAVKATEPKISPYPQAFHECDIPSSHPVSPCTAYQPVGNVLAGSHFKSQLCPFYMESETASYKRLYTCYLYPERYIKNMCVYIYTQKKSLEIPTLLLTLIIPME